MLLFIGALLTPTFIKLFSKAVEAFNMYRSVPKIIMYGFSKGGVEQFKKTITIPTKKNLSYIKEYRKIPKKIILGFIFASALLNVGVLSSLYAGCLFPTLRTTCSTLSSVVTGMATILMFIFIDPYLSIMTDDVINGDCSIKEYNRCIFFMEIGLVIATVIAQIILVPASEVIVFIAQHL